MGEYDDNEQRAAFDRVADLIATYKQFASIVHDQLHDVVGDINDDDGEPIRIHPAAGNVVNIVVFHDDYDFGGPYDYPGVDGIIAGDHFYCEHESSQNRAHRPFFHNVHHNHRHGHR